MCGGPEMARHIWNIESHDKQRRKEEKSWGGRELEAKGASDRALFKDLKERRFDLLVNTFGVNLPADPSRKSGITRMRGRGRHHHCQRSRKSLIFHALYRGARRHRLFMLNIFFLDQSINISKLDFIDINCGIRMAKIAIWIIIK